MSMKKGGGKKTSPADYAPNFTTKRRRLLTQRFKTVPYPNYLGMKIKAVRAGHVTVSFKVSDNLKQYQGLLHGGAMTSIADTAASFAALTIIPPDLDLITVDIKGNFLAAVVMLGLGVLALAGKIGPAPAPAEGEEGGDSVPSCPHHRS